MSIFNWKNKVLGHTYQGGGKGGGGGGGAPTQTTSTAYQTSIPEYARPYVETMLGATQKQLFNMDDSGNITGFSPYKPYSSNPQDYIAPFSPMQQQAQQGVANLTLPGTYEAGADISGAAAMGGMGLAGQQAQAGQNYQNQATSMYGPGSIGDYMNPYIAQSLAPQLQQLNQQFGIKGAQEQGAATSAGAFGGSRNALMQGLNQQNQQLAQQQAIAQGYDKAFQAAQQAQQFGANLGLQGQSAAQQGLGQAASSAGQMAGIGGQALQAQQGIYGAQATAGAQQQGQQQQMINQAITDYANQQQYPLMQLGVMSNMLRGLPMQAATTNQYVAAPNPVTQGIGLAGAGASIYNALKKEGGVIKEKKMAAGGIASYRGGDLIDETENDLYDMPVENLQKELKSPSPTIRRMAERIMREKTGKAGGGIIAFANPTEENNQSVVKEDPAMVRQAYIDAAKAQAADLPPVEKPVAPAPNAGIGRGRGSVAPPPPRSIVAANPEAPAVAPDVRVGRGATKPEVSPRVAAARAFEDKQRAAANAAPPVEAPPANPSSIVAAAPANVLPPAPTNVKTDNLGRADAAKQGPAPVAPPAAPAAAAPAASLANNIGRPTPPVEDTPEQIKQGIEERLKLYGVNEGSQKAREQLMAERANAKDEARRTTALRMAEFFGAWGSTPGNTIVAGLNAIKNKMPDFVTDIKEESKMRRQIDKDIAELDKLDRDEKNGIVKDYVAERQKIADRGERRYGHELTAWATGEHTKAYERVGMAKSAASGKDDLAALEGRLNTANSNLTIWEDKNSSLMRKVRRGDAKAKETLANDPTYQRLKSTRDDLETLVKTNKRVQAASPTETEKPSSTGASTAKLVPNKDGTLTYQR